jgi:hypothetical protein
VSFWRAETCRLYVQAKLAEEGKLCPFEELRDAVDSLLRRMRRRSSAWRSESV